MAYHRHPERTFYVKDIYLNSVRVDRREDLIFLNRSPILHVRLHNDNTVEIHTARSVPTERGYCFDGRVIWRILHDDEVPNAEYAGYLEAQLLGVKMLANLHNREWTQQQTAGRDADDEEEEAFH